MFISCSLHLFGSLFARCGLLRCPRSLCPHAGTTLCPSSLSSWILSAYSWLTAVDRGPSRACCAKRINMRQEGPLWTRELRFLFCWLKTGNCCHGKDTRHAAFRKICIQLHRYRSWSSQTLLLGTSREPSKEACPGRSQRSRFSCWAPWLVRSRPKGRAPFGWAWCFRVWCLDRWSSACGWTRLYKLARRGSAMLRNC